MRSFFLHPLYKTDAQGFFFFFFYTHQWHWMPSLQFGNNLKPTLLILMGLNHSKVNSCIQFSPAHSNLCIMCIPQNMMNKLKGHIFSLSCILYFTDQSFV